MIQDLPELFTERALEDQVFLFLISGIAVLLLAGLGFAVLTVVLRYRNEQTAQRWRRLEESWEPHVLDILAGDAPAEVLWNRVGDADRTYFVDFLLRYARRLRGAELETIRGLARPFLDPVVELARDGGMDQRAWAVQTLAALGLPDRQKVLVEALDDPAPAVAMVAARSLAEERGAGGIGAGGIGAGDGGAGEGGAGEGGAGASGGDVEAEVVVRKILGRLHRFDLWSHGYLADMLASFGSRVGPELEAVYLDETADPVSRAVCCQALAEIGEPRSADLAARVLEEHDLEAVAAEATRGGEVTRFGEERELVISSLRLLEELGRPDHLTVVRKLLDSRDPVLRSLAVAVVGRVGEPEEDGPAVRSALEDPSPWVALHAARALRELGFTEELERLAETDSERADLAREVLSA